MAAYRLVVLAHVRMVDRSVESYVWRRRIQQVDQQGYQTDHVHLPGMRPYMESEIVFDNARVCFCHDDERTRAFFVAFKIYTCICLY